MNNATSTQFPNIKNREREIKNNKSYNSYSDIINKNLNKPVNKDDIGDKNIFFNINGQDFNFNNHKDINSYLYINSERKKIHLNHLRLKTESQSVDFKKKIKKGHQYYLPVLMEKRLDKSKISLYITDKKPSGKLGSLKQPILNKSKANQDVKHLSFSLKLNTISNNNNINNKTKKNYLRKTKYKTNNNSLSLDKSRGKEKNVKNKNLQKAIKTEDYLDKIKNYRKKLKEQMINRYKVQYSQHGIKKDLENKNDRNHNFVFNYDSKSLNNMNEHVEKALKIFYGKIPNAKISGYEKAFLNYSNLTTEKYLLNDEVKKQLYTVNLNLIDKNNNN